MNRPDNATTDSAQRATITQIDDDDDDDRKWVTSFKVQTSDTTTATIPTINQRRFRTRTSNAISVNLWNENYNYFSYMGKLTMFI